LWGWEVASYLWTKSLASGMALVLIILSWFGSQRSEAVEIATVACCLVFTGITGLLLVKDLDRPGRFLYVLLRPQWGSWLVRGAYAILAYSLLLGCWLTCIFVASSTIIKLLSLVIVPFALLTAVYTAFLFAQARGRDFWQSPVLPLHMTGHAFAAGACGILILESVAGGFDSVDRILGYTLLITVSVNLVLALIELVTPHATKDAAIAAKLILKQPAFWFGSVIVGGLLPLIILTVFSSGITFVAAAVAALIGILVTERLWVRIPQTIPLS